MPTFQLYGDLDFRRLTNSEGSALSLPPLVLGDDVRCQFRFLEHTTDGVRERQVNVRSVKASIGPTLTPATGGTFTLCFGGNQAHASTAINFDASAADFQTAIGGGVTAASLSIVGNVAKPADGCWVIELSGGTPPATVELVNDSNLLEPESFVRIRAFQEHGTWFHEIRTVQAPLAFNSDFSRVLPPAPTIRLVADGAAATDSTPALNEIQSMVVDPSFRGTWFVRFGLRRSKAIGITDTPDVIADALNAMYSDGQKRFAVTNPSEGEAYIEFIGELAGADQPLLTITVDTFEPGVVTFVLPLGKAPMCTALREVATLTTNFEVEIKYVEDDEDPDDEEIPSKTFTACQQGVMVVREQIWDELATLDPINFLRPPQPKNYNSFGQNNIITGQQFYRAVVGDGSATSEVIDHGLATDDIFVFAWDVASKVQLESKTDFTATATSSNSVTVASLVGAIPATGWRIIVMSAQTVAAWADGLTVSIAQVDGLQDALDAIDAAVTALQDQAAHAPLGVSTTGGDPVITINIPDFSDTFPSEDGRGGLLPAINTTSITDETALPSLPSTPTLYHNTSGSALVLPGGARIKSATIAAGDYFASDGRNFYAMRKRGTTNSYFPIAFEKELWMVEVNSQMLRAGLVLNVNWDVTLQVIGAEGVTRGQYVVALEHGTAPSDASPSTTAPNLQNIVWNDTPIFTQRVVVSPVPVTHKFGAQIIRAANGDLSANKIVYGFASAADAVPASADVALRCTLRDFDTENSKPVPKGGILRQMSAGVLTIG